MPETDGVGILLAMASMAIAILGFSAIVSVFHPIVGEGRQVWPTDGRFWSMVSCGLATLVMALAPLPLLAAGVAEHRVWFLAGASQGVAGILLIIFSCHFYPMNEQSGRPASRFLFFMLLLLLTLVSILGFTNLGFLGPSVFWPVLSGITILLLTTAWLFVRLMYVWLQ